MSVKISEQAKPSTAQDLVPAFGLYGEASASELGNCHLELIETRSGPRDWRISPHLHRGLVQVILVITGAMDLSLDGRESRLEGPAALTVPMAVVHGFRFEIGSVGYVFTLRQDMLAEMPLDLKRVAEALFTHPLSLNLSDAPRLVKRLSTLSAVMLEQQGGELGHAGALSHQWMMFSVLASLDEVRRHQIRNEAHPEAGRQTWSRFQGLLNQACLEHWPINRYARELNVSESTLERLCRDMAGKSPFRLVQDRVVLEARRRLAYTRSSASEIAHVLGFSDLAYFSRFFKKETGASPTAYRKSLKEWR